MTAVIYGGALGESRGKRTENGRRPRSIVRTSVCAWKRSGREEGRLPFSDAAAGFFRRRQSTKLLFRDDGRRRRLGKEARDG